MGKQKISLSNEKPRILLVGCGTFGMQHATILKNLHDEGKITFVGVCDTAAEARAAFKAKFPDIPVFKSVTNGVTQTNPTAISNVTSTASHLPILQEALDADTDHTIKYIFQEKPFAEIDTTKGEREDHTLALTRISERINERNILFSLDSILSYSPVWHMFDTLVKENKLILRHAHCAYGKDRTKDTRPAPGGWLGMDGIHALEVLFHGQNANQITLKDGSVSAQKGHLADAAGEVTYAHKSVFQGNGTDKKPVYFQLEGSFAWKNQHRRAVYLFEKENGSHAVLQVEFDANENGTKADILTYKEFKDRALVDSTRHVFEKVNKLENFYRASIESDTPFKPYSLAQALAVQERLSQISDAQELNTTNVVKTMAKKTPALPSIEGITFNWIQNTLKSPLSEQHGKVR